jgi:molecular chaperone DnaJ
MSADYYELLGIGRDADAQQIKSAYRKLAMKLHPDRNPGDREAEEQFKRVSEAYEVLCDPQKRRIYDQFGEEGLKRQGFGGFSEASVEDIFSHFGDLFGDVFGFGRRGRRGPPRGADLRYDLVITLKECLEGASKTLEIPREQPCATCKGNGCAPGTSPSRCSTCEGHGQVTVARGFITMQTTCPRCRGQGQTITKPCKECGGGGRTTVKGEVVAKVPAGIEHGMKMRFTGQGEGAPPGGQAGDLYVVVHVQEHPRFQRDGADLHSELNVDMVQACLGDRLPFETLAGPIDVDVKAGVQPGDVVRVPGQGLPHLNSTRRGDLLLHVSVKIPRQLTEAQRTLLEEFRAAGASN